MVVSLFEELIICGKIKNIAQENQTYIVLC